MKIALVHDLAECIVGDITPFCGISPEEKEQKERVCMIICNNLVVEQNSFENIFSNIVPCNLNNAECPTITEADIIEIPLWENLVGHPLVRVFRGSLRLNYSD